MLGYVSLRLVGPSFFLLVDVVDGSLLLDRLSPLMINGHSLSFQVGR
jgi:hypothetical protein